MLLLCYGKQTDTVPKVVLLYNEKITNVGQFINSSVVSVLVLYCDVVRENSAI